MSEGDGLQLFKMLKALGSKARFIMADTYTEYEAGNLKKAGIITIEDTSTDSITKAILKGYAKFLDDKIKKALVGVPLEIRGDK